MLQKLKMKNSSNEKEAERSDKRESTELLMKNETKIDKQVITGNVTYISIENLITAEEDETRDKKKKSCLERLKEIHMSFKILAVLIGIIITLSPFIPKIVDGIQKTTSTPKVKGKGKIHLLNFSLLRFSRKIVRITVLC